MGGLTIVAAMIPSVFIGILMKRSSAQLTNVVVTRPRRLRSHHIDLAYRDRQVVFQEQKTQFDRDLENDEVLSPSLSFSMATGMSESESSNHQTLNFVRTNAVFIPFVYSYMNLTNLC